MTLDEHLAIDRLRAEIILAEMSDAKLLLSFKARDQHAPGLLAQRSAKRFRTRD